MNTGWQWAASFSALGFYLFLAVWVCALIWSRTKERLAIQETLQKLIQSGAQISPEIVDALRRTKPRRTYAQIRIRAQKFRYWGLFMVGLGSLFAWYGLRYADSPVKDLREMTGSSILIFVIPGLFFIANSVILTLTNSPPKD